MPCHTRRFGLSAYIFHSGKHFNSACIRHGRSILHVGSHLIFILIFYHGYHERYYQRTPSTLLFTQRQPINFKTSAFVVVHYQHISERRILSSPFSKSPGDLLDPAVNGTKSLLNSIKRLAPSVKRLVVTSSHAALIDFRCSIDPDMCTPRKIGTQ